MADDLTIGTQSVSAVAWITDFSGIFRDAPSRGDLVPMDFQAGAVWVQGERDAYSFDVPVILQGTTPAAVVANLRTLMALADGVQRTITRTFTSGTTAVTQTCTGVVTAVEPAGEGRLRAVLVIQNTSGVWTTPPPSP